MILDNRPIGVLDSGVGGLTSVRELHRLLPGEDIVYFGDTGRVPYGTRSKQTIRKYASQAISFLLKHDVKAILAACGTVSSVFEEKHVREMGVEVPFAGIVFPATRTACALSAGGRVGVIATPAAIHSGAYGRAMRHISPATKVFGNACPLFVPLAENGMTDFNNEITRLTAKMYLAPLIREEIDTLILGCTHYSLLYDIIGDVLEYKVTLIDAGAIAVKELQTLLCEQGLQSEKSGGGLTSYYVTDSADGFVSVAKNFLAEEISNSVNEIDIAVIDV